VLNTEAIFIKNQKEDGKNSFTFFRLDPKRSWQLSVENFQDPDQDIGKGSFKFKKILDCFKHARDALYYPSVYPIESYLGLFINVDSFLIDRSRKLKEYNSKLN